MIYLDHNSTAPYSPSVRRYLKEGVLEDWHNPSSPCLKSRELDQKIKQCRAFIADHLNCPPKHLFFTSGATESINTVLSVETLRLNQISSLITSPLEHQATVQKVKALSRTPSPEPARGAAWLHPLKSNKQNHQLKNPSPSAIKTFWVPNNEQGEININTLEELCSKHPRSLLSFLSANNETGVLTDIKTISQIAKKHDCQVLMDGVQSLSKQPVDLQTWNVDFASFSGHKIGAMKGIGLLYAKKPFAPLMYGGEHEQGLRPGTYNFPALWSLKLALQDMDLNQQEHVKKLRDYFENKLSLLFKPQAKHLSPFNNKKPPFKNNDFSTKPLSFKVNGKKAPRLPNTSSVYCGGISNQVVLLHLARKGICVSAGSACSAGSPEPSHVMTALGRREGTSTSPRDYARSCIRVSLAPSNTKQEMDYLIKCLKELTPFCHRFNEHLQGVTILPAKMTEALPARE